MVSPLSIGVSIGALVSVLLFAPGRTLTQSQPKQKKDAGVKVTGIIRAATKVVPKSSTESGQLTVLTIAMKEAEPGVVQRGFIIEHPPGSKPTRGLDGIRATAEFDGKATLRVATKSGRTWLFVSGSATSAKTSPQMSITRVLSIRPLSVTRRMSHEDVIVEMFPPSRTEK